MSATPPPAYVLDEIVCKPGKAKQVLEQYMASYVPAAKARGMELDRTLISPPMWMEEQPNTLHITWKLAGAPGFWAMSFQSRRNPDVQAFWNALEPLIEKRSRRFLAATTDVEALCDV
jgi:hypothetical protein